MYTRAIERVYTIRGWEVAMYRRDGSTGVKDFRSRMKEYLGGSAPVVLGDAYHSRAIVIPIPRHYRGRPGEARHARAEVKRRFAAALRLAWPAR